MFLIIKPTGFTKTANEKEAKNAWYMKYTHDSISTKFK